MLLQVHEVGPCTDRDGPCLVHYKRTRLTPAELNAWIYSNSSANAAVVRVYFLQSSPGVALSRQQLVEQLVAAGPAPDGGRLRLQCFPRSLEGWLGDQLPPSFNLQPVDPAWVLHIVRMPAEEQQQAEPAKQQGQQQQEERFLWSLQRADHLYNYQPVRDKRVPDQLCKAAGGWVASGRGVGVLWVETVHGPGQEGSCGSGVSVSVLPPGIWVLPLAHLAPPLPCPHPPVPPGQASCPRR